MPAFSYQAIDPQGVTQRGVLEADSARAVRSQLRARHLVPLDVAPVVSGTQTRDIVLWQRRVLNQTALTIWTRQLAGLQIFLLNPFVQFLPQHGRAGWKGKAQLSGSTFHIN